MDSNTRLLIIKTGSAIDHVVEFGDFDDWIRDGAGLPTDALELCRVDEGEPLPGDFAFSDAMITGSSAMVTEKLD